MNFFACPACSAHVKRGSVRCPHCGASTIWADGTIPRTAVAVALGLTAAASANCTPQAVADYGIACTTDICGNGGAVMVSSSSSGGAGGATGGGGHGGSTGGAGGEGGAASGGGGASSNGGSTPSSGGGQASGGASGGGGTP